ncbi:MAG: BrnT family toxin [Spirochaetes bacterium]|nr:BrnT family toxin [Spirochaetota bacterium]
MEELDFSNLTGFDWDDGNLNKNWDMHRVSSGECEEVFFNEPFFTYCDERHSGKENRFFLLGETGEKRPLFVVFTIRKSLIRVISARDMSRKERNVYETLKKNSEI